MNRPSWGPSERHGPPTDTHHYATWDAAYVLGSLSATDRREFEDHLAGCPACRDAVAELSGIPALLAQLSHADVDAISESGYVPQISPRLLPSLLETVRARRRRTRITTWAASVAAAVVLGVGVLVGVNGAADIFGNHPQPAATSAQPMAQVGTKLLTSTILFSSQSWGTMISLQCYCLAPPDAHHDTLAMVIVNRDGSQTRLATWVAEPGRTANPAGSTSTQLDQIASVRVISADSGQVLLERTL
nr:MULTISPECIES: zf-HC2 domain-containing protein [Mycobacterium]